MRYSCFFKRRLRKFKIYIFFETYKNKKSEYLFEVNGVDKKISKINKLKLSSKLVYEDKRLNKVINQVIKNKKISFTNEIGSISYSDIVLICVNFEISFNTELG